MNITDLNGSGEWSLVQIQERYLRYCQELSLPLLYLDVLEHAEGNQRWIYPVLDSVIKGMKLGNRACVAIGIDLVESDERMPFGMRLKSAVARELRRCDLDENQRNRLRRRFSQMLIDGNIPWEFREYSKLFRTIGVSNYWTEIHEQVPRENPAAMRFYHVLLQTDSTAKLNPK